MRKIFENMSLESLKEIYFESRGQYPVTEMTKDEIINVIMKDINR